LNVFLYNGGLALAGKKVEKWNSQPHTSKKNSKEKKCSPKYLQQKKNKN